MTPEHFTQQVKLELLQHLADNPKLSQRELSQKMGVALGKINFCLNALVEKGSIKLENFRGGNNRIRYAYILTPGGIEQKANLTAQFLKRKLREYIAIKAEIQALSRDLEQESPQTLSDPDLIQALQQFAK